MEISGRIYANEAQKISGLSAERLLEERRKELLIQIESAFSDILASAKSGDFYALPQIKPEFMRDVRKELESCGYLVLISGKHMYVSWEIKRPLSELEKINRFLNFHEQKEKLKSPLNGA